MRWESEKKPTFHTASLLPVKMHGTGLGGRHDDQVVDVYMPGQGRDIIDHVGNIGCDQGPESVVHGFCPRLISFKADQREFRV